MRIILGLSAFLLSSAPAWALGGFITGNTIDTPGEQSGLMMAIGVVVVMIIAYVISRAINRARGSGG
jgi:hypothetical protein